MTTAQKGFETIAALDLEPIKVKLMHIESGEGWSLERANEVETEYRRFLYLMKEFPNELAAPRFDVDIFWHYHILDTMKYLQDCEDVFGYFLHHFPYLGLRGEDDLEMHHQVGERMRELYEETFGEPYVREDATVIPATAYSVRALAPAAFSDTAYSVRAPASVSAKTAYSVRPPASASAGQTAYSVRAPATASTGRTAYSVRAPASAANQQTACLVKSPASMAEFYSNRPRLATDTTAQLRQ